MNNPCCSSGVEARIKVSPSTEHRVRVVQDDFIFNISKCEYILFPNEMYYGTIELDEDHVAYIVIPPDWIDKEAKRLKNA